QSAMSPQSTIAPSHEPRSKFGQTAGQPIVEGASSLVRSPPQSWSSPPQLLPIAAASLPFAFVIASVAFWSGHDPLPAFTTAPSHLLSALARACAACELAFAIVR